MKILESYSKTDFNYILLFLLLSLSYFSIALQNILLPIFILSVIINYKEAHFKTHFNVLLLLSTPLILTIISFFYSSNINEALKIVSRRALLVVIGLFVLAMPFNKKSFLKGFKFFLLASIVACLITIYKGLNLYLHNGTFFHPDFTIHYVIIHHPYFAAYCLLSFVFYYEFRQDINLKPIVKYSVLVLLGCGVILSNGRLAQLFLAGYVLFNAPKLLVKTNLKRVSFIILILVGTGLVIVKNSDLLFYKYKQDLNFNASPRLIIWGNALKVIENNTNILSGLGIADYQGVLDEQHRLSMKQDYPKMGLIGYNPHNQYLEFLITNGGLGLFFGIYILYFLYLAFKSKNKIFLFFTLFISWFFFTECVLNRQVGVYFIAVLLPLTYKMSLKKINE